MEEVSEEAAELVARVAALDVGKASLVACVRVPHEGTPGRHRQEVRTFATTTRSLLELRDWLTCQQVSLCDGGDLHLLEAAVLPARRRRRVLAKVSASTAARAKQRSASTTPRLSPISGPWALADHLELQRLRAHLL